jgi:hypothetical protein
MCFKRATECGLLALLLALLPAYVRLASSMPTATSAGSALMVALHTAGEDTLSQVRAKVRRGDEIAGVVPCDLEDNEGTVLENVYVLELLDPAHFKKERLAWGFKAGKDKTSKGFPYDVKELQRLPPAAYRYVLKVDRVASTTRSGAACAVRTPLGEHDNPKAKRLLALTADGVFMAAHGLLKLSAEGGLALTEEGRRQYAAAQQEACGD